MKIVVIGGSGLIGSKVVSKLRKQGHEAVPASPRSGVNTLTGEGVAEAVDGAAVVVDVSNSPSFEGAAALRFFETSTRNLLDAEAAAGVASRRVVRRRDRSPLRERLLPRQDRPGEPHPAIVEPVLGRRQRGRQGLGGTAAERRR